jgi:GR25 family glycosyltransferase involved in LPS biosynthesis
MKSYIIHLSRIPASLATAVQVQADLAEMGIAAELFEGSYGNEVQETFATKGRTCHPWTFKGPDRLLSEESKLDYTTPGVMGCFNSHYRLWQQCVALNEPIMIFEDDVTFTRGYEPVSWQDVLILVLGNPTKSAKYAHYLIDPVGKPRAESYGQSSMPGTPGYAITPSAAQKLVDHYANTFLPSDNAINKHVVQIEIHSHLMGRALIGEDGKKSLVRGKGNFWEKFSK